MQAPRDVQRRCRGTPCRRRSASRSCVDPSQGTPRTTETACWPAQSRRILAPTCSAHSTRRHDVSESHCACMACMPRWAHVLATAARPPARRPPSRLLWVGWVDGELEVGYQPRAQERATLLDTRSTIQRPGPRSRCAVHGCCTRPCSVPPQWCWRRRHGPGVAVTTRASTRAGSCAGPGAAPVAIPWPVAGTSRCLVRAGIHRQRRHERDRVAPAAPRAGLHVASRHRRVCDDGLVAAQRPRQPHAHDGRVRTLVTNTRQCIETAASSALRLLGLRRRVARKRAAPSSATCALRATHPSTSK